jgi:hypothetical protein
MVLIWRRSGIAIIIYLALSFWIVGYWYDSHTLRNSAYIGWSLFYAAIVTTLHALIILAGRNVPPEENADTPAEEQQPRSSIWTDSLFFIPVLFWPLILGGFSAYTLFSGDGNDKFTSNSDVVLPPKKKEPVEEKRVVHFLNSTMDSMIYSVRESKEGFIDEKKIAPKTYKTEEYYAGKFRITVGNIDRDIVFVLPSETVATDKSKSKTLKGEDGKTAAYRILRPPTPSKNDYDEAWVMLDGAHNLILVDVTEISGRALTEKEIKAIDWTKKIVETYDTGDLIEPLYGKDPGAGRFTVLTTGEDIPDQLRKNERVFALMSTKPGAEVTNKLITDKILDRVVLK